MHKILLVEDEEIIRKGLLYNFDFTSLFSTVVFEASNGIEAYEYCMENEVDIIITDIQMPLMNGIELIKKVSSLPIEIIIISGYSDFEYAKQAVSYGVTEYLLKPLDYELLKHSLLKAIAKLDDKAILRQEKFLQNNFGDLKFSAYDDLKFNEMIEFIKSNYASKITLDDLASHFNYSVSTIKNKFKQHDLSFNDFLNKYRIYKAIKFLEKGEFTVYEIATKVGFNDYKYFNMVFKKYTNTSIKKFIQS